MDVMDLSSAIHPGILCSQFLKFVELTQ
jgi:hypothetical protein